MDTGDRTFYLAEVLDGKLLGACQPLSLQRLMQLAPIEKLTALRDSNFITVKINYSPENYNQKALSQYPKISGYPHIFVLESNGKLLQSQATGQLEEGQSYNLMKFTDFVTKWSPPKR